MLTFKNHTLLFPFAFILSAACSSSDSSSVAGTGGTAGSAGTPGAAGNAGGDTTPGGAAGSGAGGATAGGASGNNAGGQAAGGAAGSGTEGGNANGTAGASGSVTTAGTGGGALGGNGGMDGGNNGGAAGNGGGASGNLAYIRIANFRGGDTNDPAGVDICLYKSGEELKGKTPLFRKKGILPIGTGIHYRQVSRYVSVEVSNQNLFVLANAMGTDCADNTVAYGTRIDLQPGKYYTAGGNAIPNTSGPVVLEDETNVPPPAGSAKTRFTPYAIGLPGVNVIDSVNQYTYFRAGGGGIPMLSPNGYSTVSDSLAHGALGARVWNLYRTNSTTNMFDININIVAGAIKDIFVIGDYDPGDVTYPVTYLVCTDSTILATSTDFLTSCTTTMPTVVRTP